MNPWRALGIDRTADAAEIRRAYARRLKATDVDADPAAFIALREALQRALAHAAGAARPEAQRIVLDEAVASVAITPAAAPETTETARPTADVASQLPEPDAPPSDPDPAEPPPPELAAPQRAEEDGGARFAALEALLFPEEDAPPPKPAKLTSALRFILDHPEMERVDHRAAVENWLADLLCQAIPRADPIIPMAVARFGWAADLGAVHGRPLAAHLAQRAEDLACIARLRDPSHRWHDAYVRLCEPVSGPIGFQDGAQFRVQIAQLLNGIRVHYPNVEQELDPGQVELWDRALGPKRQTLIERPDRVSWYGWLALGWVLLNIATWSARAWS